MSETPGEPVIRVFDGSRNEYSIRNQSQDDKEILRMGPVNEGSMIVAECSTSGGKPQPDVRWMNRTHVMRSKISISVNPDGSTNVTSTAKFYVTRFDLATILTCSISNNATHTPLIRQVSFDVRGKYSSSIIAPHLISSKHSLTFSPFLLLNPTHTYTVIPMIM